MATKFVFNNFPAYQEGPFAILKRDDLDGLWRVYHIGTSRKVMGQILPFKQKRDALTLAQELAKTTVDWNFTTEEEFRKLNSETVVESQIFPILTKGV